MRKACLMALALCCACDKQSKPDFGTLPRVEVTLGAQPEPTETKKSTEEPPAPAPTLSDPPDPPPFSTDRYLYYQFAFDRGEVSVRSVKEVQLAQPTPTARRIGRFALEYWIGSQLLERVRFDFPLLAADTHLDENAFEAGLRTEALVKAPWVERARRLQVVDRKTRKVVPLPWPPQAPSHSQSGKTPPAASAEADSEEAPPLRDGTDEGKLKAE